MKCSKLDAAALIRNNSKLDGDRADCPFIFRDYFLKSTYVKNCVFLHFPILVVALEIILGESRDLVF